MATNNRPLKAYVRYDGSGRIVPSSLILRKNKPKVGKWQEILAYECCNSTPTIITYEVTQGFPLSFVSVRMFCDGIGPEAGYTEQSAANMTELIELLNSDPNVNVYGTYSAINSTTVRLSVPESVKNDLCPDGVLSFQIFED
jgi:hypothetical protein